MQAFNPYLTPAQQSSQIQALQQQIGYLQNQLQSAQAAQQQYQQQMQQYQQPQIQQQIPAQNQQPGVSVRLVENFDTITANDVPMDNNGAFFAKIDGSEIQLRRWGADGTIRMTAYLPNTDALAGSAENGSQNGEKPKFDLSDETTGAFMQRFDEISNRLDLLEQAWNNKNQPKNATRAKKEADTE